MSNAPKRKAIWKNIGLALALALATVPSSFAAGEELIRLLDTAVGRFVLQGTENGVTLTTRVLGREMGAASDVTDIVTRMGEADLGRVAGKVETGMSRIQARFRERFPNDADLLTPEGARLLSAEQQEFLRSLAFEELNVDIRFFPEALQGGFNVNRATFIRALELHPAGAPMLRYPVHVDPLAHPDWHMQFGFESEYQLKEAEKLLEMYSPGPEFEISPERWLNMSKTERMGWVQDHLAHTPLNAEPSGLLLMDHAAEQMPFMPKQLVLDSTGNLEIVMSPVDTLEQWKNQVDAINARFGTGSMQAALSVPSDSFFGRLPGGNVEAAVQQDLGYLNFINDYDVLEKLEAGAARFEADPTKPVAQSLQHPWLGPINRLKQLRLAKFLAKNSVGEYYEPERLAVIRSYDGSFKYIGSTSYRPDIAGPERAVLEIRDAHKNFELLLERLTRSTFYLQMGREQFAGASGIKAFDSVADFDKLSERVQNMLKELYPSRQKLGVPYSEENIISAQVYRNFSYPLRDWNPNLQFLGKSGMAGQVAQAQAAYVAKLESAASELASGRITAAEANLRVQGAAAQFSTESGLARAYGKFQAKNIFADPAYGKYMDLTVHELGPFRAAFPKTVWEGSLEMRMTRFTNKWRAQVRVVDGANFTYRAPAIGYARSSARKVLVISTEGLDAARQAELLQDYTNAMSRGTVSFPMGENGNHLYTRLGNRSLDFYFGSNAQIHDYKLSSGNRLEPVIALSPEEELKLRFYVEQASTDGADLLGPSGYDGVPDGDTGGSLRDNRPMTGSYRHNCTSWLCTAPVGANNEALHELVGAPKGMEVYTNPQYWSAYLSGAATAGRIPFVVYWTSEPLSATESFIGTGLEFPGARFFPQ